MGDKLLLKLNIYERLDRSRDSHVTAEELLKFLTENYVKDTTLVECKDIIAEFDSNMDGTLAYDEFLNCFLPAANISLREYIIYNKRVASYYTQSSTLPISVSSMAVRILEREKNMTRKRNDVRMALFKSKSHQKLKTFNEISRGQLLITMPDLIYFLEENGFHPRTSDIEAILRRADHDADRAFSFQEFSELIEIPAETEEVAEDNGIVLGAQDRSPVK
jgi:Ca2+-binding EF-hand superfamily protein